MGKICKNCNLNKDLSEFHKSKSNKLGVLPICKLCRNTKLKENYDSEKTREIHLKYSNSEKGKETIKRVRTDYYQNNKEAENKRSLDWAEKNKKFVKKYNKEYNKIRKINDKYKIMWRSVLTNSLKRLGNKKEGHTIDLLGYSALDLKFHIESLFTDGMTWENYGEWHIDHIKGVCQYADDTPLYIVNSLSNLRPLWATTREINGIIYEGNLNRPKF